MAPNDSRLRGEVPRDLGAGRLPHALVPADMGERGIEGIDAMGHAGQVRMDGDRHDAARLRAFAVEHVELPADHVAELAGGAMLALEHRLVVDLLRIRHGHHLPPARERHRIGLIVIDPIADIFATLRRQEVERVPGLLQAGAEPTDRPRPGRFRDGGQGAGDDAGLLAGRRLVQPARVALVVAHPFPPAPVALLDDGRMLGAQLAVERDRGADAVAVEHLHQPEHADPVAVVAHRPGRNVGDRRAAAARGRRHLLGEREELDIGNDPERHPRAVGPAEHRPPDDRGIGKRAVGRWLHPQVPAAARRTRLGARPSGAAGRLPQCSISAATHGSFRAGEPSGARAGCKFGARQPLAMTAPRFVAVCRGRVMVPRHALKSVWGLR